MSLTEKAIARLSQLGYRTDAELAYWRGLWEREGESFFWDFLRSDEAAAKERERWFPRLRQFAADCRQAVPIPDPAAFSKVERVQHEILHSKMQKFAASDERNCIFGRTPYQVPILSTTRIGLAAAQSLFGDLDAVVILCEEEKQRWFSEIYNPGDAGFWWYAIARWLIHEDFDGLDKHHRDILSQYPLPEGSVPWVIVSGVIWGSLAGGAGYELWCWDGARAEFIETYCCETY